MTKFKVGDRVQVQSREWFEPAGDCLATVTEFKRGVCYVELDTPTAGPRGRTRFSRTEGWACDFPPTKLKQPSIFTKVGRLIKAERTRQDAKFGPKGNLGNLSREERLAVLTEEVGELAMAINGVRENFGSRAANSASMKEELVQVAAVAVAWLEVLEERGVEG